ncbi:unnamed protein product [Adineta ricciae]|uniref:Uncharacterized protein n=1 Tax=Adineta ricciae TaxID=249248 RepID=A0A814SIL9_ADIRI|nr:unnamed protein product [Adineta ricciae]CAF1319462.1 unnamed protein product [Adineta ricciae]
MISTNIKGSNHKVLSILAFGGAVGQESRREMVKRMVRNAENEKQNVEKREFYRCLYYPPPPPPPSGPIWV